MDSDYEQVVNTLSRLIQVSLAMRDSESSRPSRTPDASDFYIGTLKGRIETLRRIRQEFEDVMTTSLVETP